MIKLLKIDADMAGIHCRCNRTFRILYVENSVRTS